MELARVFKTLTATVMMAGGLVLLMKGKDVGSTWLVGGILLASLLV
jgi:hypothetical protein